VGKYYIKSGKNKMLMIANTPFAAAMQCVSAWRRKKNKMEISVRVSEVGFESDSDHPHHVLDIIFPTNYIKGKLKS